MTGKELLNSDDFRKRLELMRQQRAHQPRRGTMRTQAPKPGISFPGLVGPGKIHYASGSDKAPKRRFNLGDRFEHENEPWELVYMYRTKQEPGVWIHAIANRAGEGRLIDKVVEVLGGGSTTSRIVFTPFTNSGEARQYFWDVPMKGDSIHMTTQQLLKLKRL